MPPAPATAAPAATRDPQALRHRSDIDGLRALAVLPVCLFHAGVPALSGGFVGVDVFFVISGFLMASLIGKGLDGGRFSYLQFYQRRVRRIFPALFAILAACAVVAAVVMPPRLLSDFCASLVATVFFGSNILFWHKTDQYFDSTTELNPLLHTWSLAVEEQFYIVFPVYLAIAWRLGRNRRFLLTAALAAASFAISVWGVANAPTATFYLAPTRIWEMLIGALVALAPRAPSSARTREALGLVGLLLIVVSFAWLDPESAFPGAAALPACVGTAAILHSGREGATLAGGLLSRAPLVFVGKISYSLYLWHWPLIVFADRYGLFGASSAAHRLFAVLVAFPLAILSWRYVEEPLRRSRKIGRRAIFAGAAACMLILAAAGGAGLKSGGWPARFPGIEEVSLVPQLAAEEKVAGWSSRDQDACFLIKGGTWGGERCFLSRHARENALLWGDSFANHYAFGLFENRAAPVNILQYTSAQCAPILGYRPASRPQCGRFNAGVDKVLRDYDITTVILAANWHEHFQRHKLDASDLAATVATLTRRGLRVVVVGQSPTFGFPYPDEYFFLTFGAAPSASRYWATVDFDPAYNRALAAASGAARFFDPMAVLCRGDQCLFKEGTQYLFRDYGHYSGHGSRKMADALLAVLRDAAD